MARVTATTPTPTSTSTSFCNCSNSRLLLGLAGPPHHISFSSRLPVRQFPHSILKCKPLQLSLGTQGLRRLSFSSSSVPSSSSPSPHPHPHLPPSPSPSPWDDKPYEVLPDGKKSYLDEQDVVTFLDPPTELVPLDPSSFNPASYLWKKVSDIPEERRHRLLRLIRPRLISAAWAISGTRYDNPQFAEKSSSGFLRVKEADASSLEYWNCRKSGGPVPFAWINIFKMALFHQDGGLYGRFTGGSLVGRMASPLYFSVQQTQELMPTGQPCDLAYEFGDGLLDISAYPQGFPRSAKHPWPFNDQLVVYVRHVGPGVMVGQAWQEGVALEQVPKKFCGEILMVKDYSRFS